MSDTKKIHPLVAEQVPDEVLASEISKAIERADSLVIETMAREREHTVLSYFDYGSMTYQIWVISREDGHDVEINTV